MVDFCTLRVWVDFEFGRWWVRVRSGLIQLDDLIEQWKRKRGVRNERERLWEERRMRDLKRKKKCRSMCKTNKNFAQMQILWFCPVFSARKEGRYRRAAGKDGCTWRVQKPYLCLAPNRVDAFLKQILCLGTENPKEEGQF